MFDEDDYFRANLPPTYDMEPLPASLSRVASYSKKPWEKEEQSEPEVDDYFRANLPPTYDMEPLPVDAFAVDEKIVSKAATKGGLDHPAEMFVFYFLFFVIFLAILIACIRYD